MATSQTRKVFHHIRSAVLMRDGAGMTDGQLLGCFLTQRDAAAFAALVRRHGPMVWGVCRRVLHNHHDAEDAFQATFLVLDRKATTVEPKEQVANWLYGVAYKTALKAKSLVARRKGRERQVVEMPEPVFEEQHDWDDLRTLLDQELSRLPDKYRVPVVLCDLEGKTRKEAAQLLGWPEGTVAGRLAAARKLLAARLARRGVVLSGATLATMLTHNAALACVPYSVVSSTIQSATTLAAGQAAASGLISAKVAALKHGVLKSMLLTKVKTGVAVLLTVLVLGAGLGRAGLLYMARAAQGAPDVSVEKDVKNSGDAATGDGKKADRPTLSGTWGKKVGALKIEFADKGVMKIAPHGDSTAIAIVCDYTVEQEGLVKARVTGVQGNGAATKHIGGLLPAGTQFSFKWTVKADAAKLDDLAGDKVEVLRHLLVGDFEQKNDDKKKHGHGGGDLKHLHGGAAHDKEAAAPAKIKVGDRVSDFSVRTLDGKSLKLSELQKDESLTKSGVIVLSFWCTTCHSCRDVEELLAKLARDYEGRAAVFALAANADETGGGVTAFLKKVGLALPVVLDPSGHTADLFGIKWTTTTVVIDGNGVLRYCGQFRQKDGGSAEEALNAVLAGKEVAIKTTPHQG
jgi:RNA polymerase sigma factor (sigma-70 family)